MDVCKGHISMSLDKVGMEGVAKIGREREVGREERIGKYMYDIKRKVLTRWTSLLEP